MPPHLPMSRTFHRVINVGLVIGIFVFMGAGLATANLCNGGYALILFGVAVGCLAALIYRMGAWATIIPFAIICLTLIAGGWYGASVAGCHF